jgi:hypothetical protein
MKTDIELIELVDRELELHADPAQRQRARSLLVPPRCEERFWDYGEEGLTYSCWIVMEYHRDNADTATAYCEQGFGPMHPWGLLSSDPQTSMGMDCGWFAHLGECLRDSFAWDFIEGCSQP